MAVDRGGLNYRISITDGFSKNSQKFRDELLKNKAAFADFQASAAASRDGASALRDTADAARALSEANRSAARSTRQRAQEAKKAKEIDDLVLEAAQRAQTARQVQARAEQVGFDLKRKVIKQLTVEQQAQQEAVRVLRRREVQERRNQILAAQGVQVGKQKARELSIEEEALKRVEARLRSLAIAERVRNEIALRKQGPQIDDVERAAITRVEDALRKKAVAERAAVIAGERGVELGKKKARQLTIEEEALKRVAAQNRRAEIQARVQALQDQARIGPRLPGGGFFAKDATKQVEGLRTSLKGVNSEGNNLLFTFRRLFGIFAAFQAIRIAVQGFFATIREGLEFNSQIEQARISIGGLINATAQARDQFGQLLSPAQQLVAAEREARRQVQLLRQDALNTTATFEELLDTFQVAITPGLAGGLSIDEVRKLAVNVSQAAQALGIAQNQLSEEIRSVIQGTGQLRTTRLLALVSNEEIRRAREAGTLFALLNERLGGFNEASERAARSTLPGVLARLKDFFQAALGGASRQLFEDLLTLGNALFDRVLTVRNELGEIKVNPQIVAILGDVFDALRDILATAVEAGRELGLQGARDGVRVFAQALRVAGQVGVGVVQGLIIGFRIINGVIQTFASILGLSNESFGKLAATAATVVAPLLLIKSVLGSIGINLALITTLMGKQLVANIVLAGKAFAGAFLLPLASATLALGAVLLGFNQVAEAIFGVNLSLSDTVDLLGFGLAGAFQSVIEFVQVAFVRVSGFFRDALEAAVDFGRSVVNEAAKTLAALRGDIDELNRLSDEQSNAEAAQRKRNAEQRKKDEEEIARIRELGTLTQLDLENKIAKVVGEAAGTDAQGEGFNVPNFNFDQFLKGLEEVKFSLDDGTLGPTFLSTVLKDIQQIEDELTALEDELRKARLEFAGVFNAPAVSGAVGQIADIFRKQVVDSSEKARQVTLSLLNTQRQIAALRERSGPFTDEQELQIQGQLNTLLQEEQLLIQARNGLFAKGLELARTRAATIAAQELPNLKIENQTLRQRLTAERAIADAIRTRATDSQVNVIQARNALQSAQLEAQQRRQQLETELQILRTSAVGTTGEQRKALLDFITQKERQLSLEQQITAAQEVGLQRTLQTAQIVANGSITDGLREGLVQLANELPTFAEAGITIMKSGVQAFSSFLSQALVSAFDPNSNASFEEQLGRFLQSLAQTIIDQLLQAALGSLISNSLGLNVGASTLQIAATTLAATVPGLQAAATTLLTAASLSAGTGFGRASGGPIGLAKGGSVASHARAKGYRGGGRIRYRPSSGPRPRGLDRRDTIPIWAARGEYMQQASAVRLYGLRAMEALNQGLINPMALQALATNTAPAAAHVPAVPGYADGGMIADHVASKAASPAATGSGDPLVLPAVVAREGDLRRMLAGGKQAMLGFIRENASDISSVLQRRSR